MCVSSSCRVARADSTPYGEPLGAFEPFGERVDRLLHRGQDGVGHGRGVSGSGTRPRFPRPCQVHRHQGAQLVPRVRRRTPQRPALLQFVTGQAAAREGDFTQDTDVIAQYFLGDPRLGHAFSSNPATVRSSPRRSPAGAGARHRPGRKIAGFRQCTITPRGARIRSATTRGNSPGEAPPGRPRGGHGGSTGEHGNGGAGASRAPDSAPSTGDRGRCGARGPARASEGERPGLRGGFDRAAAAVPRHPAARRPAAPVPEPTRRTVTGTRRATAGGRGRWTSS